MKQQFSTASNYSEACDMLRSGYVKHVRLNWNIGSDEFFRIASDWCDTGAKIKKDEDGGNDSNLLIVFYVQIMPDDFVMQLHRF